MADLSYHPEAKDEIRKVADYYQRRRQGLGEEFLAELEAVIGKILMNPLRCARISGRFRCCLVKRFPFGIIYAIDDDQIFVAAVAHSKRRPGYWKQRVGSD